MNSSSNNVTSTQLKCRENLVINRFGYGAMHLTGYGMWGPPSDPKHAIRLLRHAVHDLGVNFIDTADSYGPGDNEEIIRHALYPYPENLIISTKGGMLRSGQNDWIHGAPGAPYIVPLGRPEYLRQQVEMSLRRLGLERITLYQLHSVDPQVPLAESLGELTRLREQGKIHHIGLSNQPGVTMDQLNEAHQIADIVSIESLYNISDHSDDEVLRRAEQLQIAFIPWFPLGHGRLVGSDSVLTAIAEKYGMTAAQLALCWLLHRSPATVLIPGTNSIKHLEENARATTFTLTKDDMVAITTIVDKMDLSRWRPTR